MKYVTHPDGRQHEVRTTGADDYHRFTVKTACGLILTDRAGTVGEPAKLPDMANHCRNCDRSAKTAGTVE